jgi:hypothetical protein
MRKKVKRKMQLVLSNRQSSLRRKRSERVKSG